MIRLASTVLLLFGIVGGTLCSSARSTLGEQRGGYEIIEADFHAHSHAGDGMLSPFGLVFLARQKGLRALAITDHNQIFGAKAGRWFSQLIGGPTVLVGEEITAPGFHMIGLGLHERIAWQQSAAEAIEAIHRQGGLAIAAHPGRKYQPAFGPVITELDGAEIMHPLVYASSDRAKQLQDFYEQSRVNGDVLTAMGSSDYHWFNSLGLCRTYVFARSANETDILDALRAGRTVVYNREGRAFGKPELTRLLTEQPITRNNIAYEYSPSSVIDSVTRTFGCFGLIGLTIFRPRKRSTFPKASRRAKNVRGGTDEGGLKG